MPDTFISFSWNTYHGTNEDRLRQGFAAIKAEGATCGTLQEAQNIDPDLLAEFSYDSVRVGENMNVWQPGPWVPVSHQPITLSTSAFFRPGRSRPVRPKSPLTILAEPQGRTLSLISIHTPSSVQRKGVPNDRLPRRVTVLAESMATLGQLRRNAKTHAVIASGDDNVSEDDAPSVWEAITGRLVTGMARVVPPGPTMGKRSIDEFRVARLGVERVWSMPGFGQEKPAHAIIFAEFRWRR